MDRTWNHQAEHLFGLVSGARSTRVPRLKLKEVSIPVGERKLNKGGETQPNRILEDAKGERVFSQSVYQVVHTWLVFICGSSSGGGSMALLA